MTKTTLLINEPPLQLLPSLAKLIGLNEAIVTQQLHFYLSNPKCGVELDGERWIYNTYSQWQEECFCFWSVETIKRTFLSLEEMSIVISCQPDGRESRRKYYRLNKGMVEKLTFETLADQVNLTSSNGSSCSLPERVNLTSSLYTENHKETKARSQKESSIKSKMQFPEALDTIDFQEAWDDWTEHRKELKKPLTKKTISAQLKKLSEWGSDKAVEAIRNAIEHGWTGLFKPDEKTIQKSRTNPSGNSNRNEGTFNEGKGHIYKGYRRTT